MSPVVWHLRSSVLGSHLRMRDHMNASLFLGIVIALFGVMFRLDVPLGKSALVVLALLAVAIGGLFRSVHGSALPALPLTPRERALGDALGVALWGALGVVPAALVLGAVTLLPLQLQLAMSGFDVWPELGRAWASIWPSLPGVVATGAASLPLLLHVRGLRDL